MNDQHDDAPGAATAPAAAPAGRRRRPARDVFASAVLTSEAFVVFFATLVAYGLREPGTPAGLVFGVGGAGVLLCLVAAGMVGRRGGVVVGTAVQAPLVLSGLLVPTMWVVGALFAVLWVVGMRLGARIDRERAEREEAEVRAAEPGRSPAADGRPGAPPAGT